MGKSNRRKVAAGAAAEAPGVARTAPRRAGSSQTVWLLAAVLLVLALVPYWQTLSHPFINFDDPEYVYENTHVLRGLAPDSIAWAFSNFYSGNWHPLTWMSHMLDVSVGGPGAGPQHRTNVLLHAANVLLLFWALRRMTAAPWRSAIVAALFAVHPLNVETVAWVSERKSLLCMFFSLLAVLAYIEWGKKRTAGWYAGVVVLFALALMSKPMAVTLPLLLLVLDYWPLDRTGRSLADAGRKLRPLLIEKIPLFALTAVFSYVTWKAQASQNATATESLLPLSERILNAMTGYGWYLLKMVWPSSLSILYPHPFGWGGRVNVPAALVSGVAVAAITALVFVAGKRRPCLIAGWLWYVIALVPVIGIVQVGSQSHADRYAYLPFVGLFMAIVWGVADALQRNAELRKLAVAVASIAVIAYAWTAASYAAQWKDERTLYTHSIAVTDRNWLLVNNLGYSYLTAGDVNKALEYFRAAEKMADRDLVLTNVGIALLNLGKPADAVTYFRRALSQNPGNVLALVNLGHAQLLLGDGNAALQAYESALRTRPDDAGAYYGLTMYYSARGDRAKRDASLEKLRELNPKAAEALSATMR